MNRTGLRHRLKHIAAGITAAVTGAGMILYLPASVFAADETGTTTDGFDYKISENDVTITGYSGDNKETVTKLAVPASVKGRAVTRIENGAFSSMHTVKTLTLPDTVTFIGVGALSGMSISKLTLPSSIQQIRAGFISECENLKTITIPKGIPRNSMEYSTYLGGGWGATFKDSYIEKFILEDGIEWVPDYLTLGATHYKEIVIPDSVTIIGAGAFDSNEALTDFTVPEGVKEVMASAFNCCVNLETVTLPSTLEIIGAKAFRKTPLTKITLPEGLKEAGSSVFEECENLTALTIPSTVEKAAWMLSNSSVKTLTFADGMETVPEYIAGEDAALKKVILPRSVTALGSNCFQKSGIEEFTVPKQLLTANNSFSESMLETVSFEDGLEKIPDKLFQHAVNLKTINWNKSLKEIGENSFASCKALETAEIPDYISTIGYSAFRDCISLTKVHLPDCKAKIGNYAFASCAALEYAYVPVIAETTDNYAGYYDGFGCHIFQDSGLKKIEFAPETVIVPSVCYGCKSLTEIIWPTAPEVIERSAFDSCISLTKLNIPDTVTKIRAFAFNGCEGVTDLHLPENLTSLDSDSFAYLKSLKYLYFPHELTESSITAFKNSGIEKLEIADGVTQITATFGNLHELRQVSFPDSLVKIGENAFTGDEKLTNVKLPPNLESLGNYAFNQCESLTKITIPKTLKETGWSTMFEHSGLEEAWIEDGMEVIPSDLFDSAGLLRTVHIPASVKEIQKDAFYNCVLLETVDAPQDSLKFWSSTFRNCDSLDDERFSVCLNKDSFINSTVSYDGENRLVHYTVYYSVNPRFRELMSDISLKVSTAWRADILRESLPEDISAGQGGFSFTPEKPEGVIRFSVRASDAEDTSVKVTLGVKQNNDYDWAGWYERNIVSPGNPTPELSLSTPNFAKTAEGVAAFSLSGYAPAGQDVVISVKNQNSEEAAAEITVKASPYTGKYYTDIEIAAEDSDVLDVQAVCGSLKQTATVVCDANQNKIVSVLLMHDGKTTDITESFTIGTMPFFGYRPNLPLGFEVKLENNDCAAVMMTSAVDGNVSAIELTYDAESDSWKGEGKFATTIPGTLNVVAFPNTYQERAKLVKDGDSQKLMINGRQFLDSTEEENTFIGDFVKDTNGKLVAMDDKGIITGYDLSVYTGEASGIVSYIGRQDSLTLASGKITPQDVMDDPEAYGFEPSPLTITDEDGTYHVYYVKILEKQADFKSLYDSIKVADTAEAAEPAKPLPVQKGAGTISTAEYQTLGQRFFNFLADLGENADDAGKYANGSVVTEFTYDHAPVSPLTPGVKPKDVFGADGNVKDFVINLADTGRKEVVDNAVKGMFKNAKAGEKFVGEWGDGMAYAEIAVRTTGMISQLRDITNSTNPVVNKNENAFYAASIGLTMAKATHIVAGGAAISATITSFSAVVATGITGAALLPEILAVGAVIGVVWGIGKLLDYANDKLNETIRGKAKVGQDGRVRPVIDPSGIAYEYRKNNPIAGVTANIYYQDDDGNAVLWNAADYDQVNPQTTAHDGWFAWDVPEGLWQVRLTKKGYTDAQSEWLPVLPVQVGIDLNMTSKNPAAILTADYYTGKAVIRFNRHVLTETVTPESLYLTDASGNVIPCSISILKEDGNDAEASIAFLLKAQDNTSLEGSSVNLTADVKSYAGIASKAKTVKLAQGSEDIPDEPDFLTGDVNGDQDISVDDAQLALRAYVAEMAGKENGLEDWQCSAADVNSDDKVTVEDAQLILLYYVKNTLANTPTPWEALLG